MTASTTGTVAIIGAGVAGLATARALREQGFDCTVFDRAAKLGGVWADGYSNFGVQVQKELYEFPDWPLPPDTPNFTPGPEFQSYLEAFADQFGIRSCIRLNTAVMGAEPLGGGAEGWQVSWQTGDAPPERALFDHLVIATGLYSNTPHMPKFKGREEFAGDIIHNSQLKSRDRLEDRKVLVVGFGKSATDAALEALAVTDSVHMVFRRVHWPVPRNLAGVLPFKFGMLNRFTAALIKPHMDAGTFITALHGVGKPLPWLFWRAVELLLYVQFRLWTRTADGQNLVPQMPVEIGCFGETTMVPRPDLYRAFRDGRITPHLAEISSLTPTGIVLKTGREIAADIIICATGWENAHTVLPDDVLDTLGRDDDGFYLFRHILNPDVPNLYFIGRASSFLSVATHSLQARWLAGLLTGDVSLPSQAAMREEIERMKAWKRSWMPAGGTRAARVLLHQMTYHDELVRDVGANPHRKRGVLAPLKELFAPYQSSDYREVVSTATTGAGGAMRPATQFPAAKAHTR